LPRPAKRPPRASRPRTPTTSVRKPPAVHLPPARLIRPLTIRLRAAREGDAGRVSPRTCRREGVRLRAVCKGAWAYHLRTTADLYEHKRLGWQRAPLRRRTPTKRAAQPA